MGRREELQERRFRLSRELAAIDDELQQLNCANNPLYPRFLEGALIEYRIRYDSGERAWYIDLKPISNTSVVAQLEQLEKCPDIQIVQGETTQSAVCYYLLPGGKTA